MFIGHTSPKCFDLRNDGRYALHAPLGPDDEEFVITGRVIPVTNPTARLAAVSAAKHAVSNHELGFELLVGRCLWGVWENVGQPDTRPRYRVWTVSDDGKQSGLA